MTDPRISDGLSVAITKLDTLFAGSDLTEINQLQQQEITLKLANLTSKDVRTIVFGKKEFIIEEIGTPTSTIISKNFMVGDVITKVNGKELEARSFINNLLTAMNMTTVVLKRRAYASVPEEHRLKGTLTEISQPRQKGYAYQIITCNKMRVRQEKIVEGTFGFLAIVLGGKYVVVKIAEHSAAEKFFSIGDSILDLNGRPLRSHDQKDINLINPAFQRLGEITILVERPVTSKARKEVCARMGKYLETPNTEPTMADDAIAIGKNAANYHRKLWKRLEPISIVMEHGHKASPKKRSRKSGRKDRKKGDKDEKEENGEKSMTQFSSMIGPRVMIDPKRNCVEITSDLTDHSLLEKVGSRYSEDSNERDEKKQKKRSSLLNFLMN